MSSTKGGLGEVLGGLAGVAGQLVVSSWLSSLTRNNVIVAVVARAVYEEETHREWRELDGKGKEVWLDRVRSTVRALGTVISGRYRSPTGL